jgi:hypothetical protein
LVYIIQIELMKNVPLICRISSFVLIGLFITFSKATAQTYIVRDSPHVTGTVVVIPGKEYVRSGYHNFFWGKHYRKEWGTPIRVNEFYIDTAYGGLEPMMEGGSRQSSGIRLKAKNGKEYVLRSVNKDYGNGLDDKYQGTFVSKVAKDLGSWGYPMAAITITPMIAPTGIYHTNPRIVFDPKQKG